MKNKNIIIYDFDGTLTPYAMPKFEVLERCGFEDGAHNSKFMDMIKQKSQNRSIDLYSAIYDTYFEMIQKGGLRLTDDNFCLGSDTVEYNQGVFEFLDKLAENNVKNYLLSSGLKVFLKRTKIANYFEEIYATTFSYKNGEATGIEYLMSDKNKVEAIKQIIKVNGNALDDCSNVIYIGDGLTDFYAMKYVKDNGGISIFVYQDSSNGNIEVMKEKNVVDYFTLADFSSDSDLNNYVMNLLNL